MELYGADVVQVAEEGKEASAEFVVPYFDFVVVTARGDEGFEEVEVDSADWAVVFFETIDYGSDAVVPPVLRVM